MFSWEIDNYLKENNYKTTHSKVREIMIVSPQVNHFKLLKILPEYSQYQWWTSDDYTWIFYVKNEVNNE